MNAVPKTIRWKIRTPVHIADFTSHLDVAKAVIKLADRWIVNPLARLNRDGVWLPIEVTRLLHTEAPVSLDAFRIYLSDGLVGYNDQFSDEDVLLARTLIASLAEYGDDVSIDFTKFGR